MASLSTVSPFKRESQPIQLVWTYKVLTMITWLVNVLVNVYYTFGMPDRDLERGGITVWMQNTAHPTPFTLDTLLTSVYWGILLMLQICYLWHMYSNNNGDVQAAAGVGSHFVVNNIFQTGFVLLFVRGSFYLAELILAINFLNLTVLYFRHNTSGMFVHMPVVSGPLAFTYVAVYWNGAIAVNSHTLLAGFLANVAIWSLLVYGWFFLFVEHDYSMGFALSLLSASIGVGQYYTHTVALQCAFAFAASGLLFASSLLIVIPGCFGKEISFRRYSSPLNMPVDPVRNPLLDDF